jgi:hypothetical protein
MKMKSVLLNIDNTFKELELAQEKLTKAEARRQVAAMKEDLKAATPIDTGYARSRWEVDETEDAFYVKNDADYIQYLNEGSSKQAPAYFVESVALKYGKPVGTIVETKE